MEVFRPKHAMNWSLDLWELIVYLMSLVQLFVIYFVVDRYMVDISPSWLGFALAFVNYRNLGRVVGIKDPDRTVLKARCAILGSA